MYLFNVIGIDYHLFVANEKTIEKRFVFL